MKDDRECRRRTSVCSAGTWVFMLCWLIAGPIPAANGQKSAEVFLQAAHAYADSMIEKGRDSYGTDATPLFAAQLHRSPVKLPETFLPDVDGVRNVDRMWFSANPMHHQQLHRLLLRLSDRTGDPRYAARSKEALQWFFEHTMSPATDLLAWGEHLGWNLREERFLDQEAIDTTKGRNVHEFFESWRLWPEIYAVAPERARRFAQGLWNHQIYDKALGTFSREAAYAYHRPQGNSEFPRHGGYYIATWADAYTRSTDPAFRDTMLAATESLVRGFNGRRNEQSDALPAGGGGNVRGKYWLKSDLELTAEVSRVLPSLPNPTSAMVRELIRRSDATILAADHDEYLEEEDGYVTSTAVGDLSSVTASSSLYAKAYGRHTTAAIGQWMLERAWASEVDSVASRYRALAVAGAERYLTVDPDTAALLYPYALSRPIDFMLSMYEYTGEIVYLGRAQFFGGLALRLFVDETSPLPRVTTQHTWYEPITGGDDLMLSLFRLALALEEEATDSEGVTAGAHATALTAIYPNPSRKDISIRYHLARRTRMTLELFDLLGRRVAVIADDVRPAGSHVAHYDAARHAAGAYVVVLTAERTSDQSLLHRVGR